MIAIPDFGSGAMENWGLVTYRETVLLYDEEEASEGWKRLVCTIISHELAHQARSKRLHRHDEESIPILEKEFLTL